MGERGREGVDRVVTGVERGVDRVATNLQPNMTENIFNTDLSFNPYTCEHAQDRVRRSAGRVWGGLGLHAIGDHEVARAYVQTCAVRELGVQYR